MPSRRLKDAIEDARGILMMFNSQGVSDDDCVTAVRQAIVDLEAAISAALDTDGEGRVSEDDRAAIQQRLRNLFMLWDQCGHRTQALMFDMRVVFGPHLGVGLLAPGPTEPS